MTSFDRGKTCDTRFSGALHDYPVGSGQEKQKTGNRKYTLGTLKKITDQMRHENACCYAIQDHRAEQGTEKNKKTLVLVAA
ncbi:hypothetical protein ACE41H_21245 [Paenibacillus enshidis]|uniref:Uncharacterized protein n=1 Tax=Paenibacillus enshidis TaxID=1458439 RepID=A0ABV5AZ78_9BACL